MRSDTESAGQRFKSPESWSINRPGGEQGVRKVSNDSNKAMRLDKRRR